MIKVGLSIAALFAAGTAFAQSGVAIVNVGSEQAVRIGETTITRPFGGQLVDRLAVAGRYRVGDLQLVLIRGDGEAHCPASYVIAGSRGGHDVTVTEPFGTCSTAAVGRVDRFGLVVSMPATALGGPMVRFAYENGSVRLLDASPAATEYGGPQGALGMGARAPSNCRSATATDPATQTSVIADFEANFPREFGTYGGLHRAEIDPASMRSLVTGLACLYSWPAAQRVVSRRATPLFASGRYGHAAFAALETVARDPETDVNLGAALKSFGSEMHFRVERRDALELW